MIFVPNNIEPWKPAPLKFRAVATNWAINGKPTVLLIPIANCGCSLQDQFEIKTNKLQTAPELRQTTEAMNNNGMHAFVWMMNTWFPLSKVADLAVLFSFFFTPWMYVRLLYPLATQDFLILFLVTDHSSRSIWLYLMFISVSVNNIGSRAVR